MIAELGHLKDSGLRVELLHEAGISAETDAAATDDILKQASAVVSTFSPNEIWTYLSQARQLLRIDVY